MDFTQIQNYVHQKIPLKEWKGKPQMGEDIFKMHHWQKELLQTKFFFLRKHFF